MRLKSCVAIAGTNGKTTTTTMVAALLDAGVSIHGRQWPASSTPMAPMRGLARAIGVVVEADESDGTFLRLPSTVAVSDQRRSGPSRLLRHLRQDARCVPALRRERAILWLRGSVYRSSRSAGHGGTDHGPSHRDLWGFRHKADVRALNVSFSQGASHFGSDRRRSPRGNRNAHRSRALPMPGEAHCPERTRGDHGRPPARRSGHQDPQCPWTPSKGLKRRFTKVGEWNGTAIIDDYGHNPFKIAAALKAARQAYSGPGDRGRPAASLHAPCATPGSSSAPA